MIVLKYNTRTEKIEQIEERLKEMTLGYETKQAKSYKNVTLEEGDDHFQGYPAIHKYLDEIQSELKQWWYCNC